MNDRLDRIVATLYVICGLLGAIFALLLLSSCAQPRYDATNAPQTHPVHQTVYPERLRGTPDIRSVYSDGTVRWE